MLTVGRPVAAMGKRDRLEDAVTRQRRIDKKVRREKHQHRRLEQRAEMLKSAVSLDDLKEQLRVLEQLTGTKKGAKSHRKEHKGKKAPGGADPLQLKRMEELREKISILEAAEGDDENRDTSGDDDDDGARSDSRGSSRSSSGASSDNETGEVGAPTEQGGGAGLWAAFFEQEPAAAAGNAAGAPSAPSQPQRHPPSASSVLFGVKVDAKPKDAPGGVASLAKGATAASFVPRAVQRRKEPVGAGGSASAAAGPAAVLTVLGRAADPLARPARPPMPAVTGESDDDLDALLADVDEAVANAAAP
jgi:hypothetical protein